MIAVTTIDVDTPCPRCDETRVHVELTPGGHVSCAACRLASEPVAALGYYTPGWEATAKAAWMLLTWPGMKWDVATRDEVERVRQAAWREHDAIAKAFRATLEGRLEELERQVQRLNAWTHFDEEN